jgi:hypothetical protein
MNRRANPTAGSSPGAPTKVSGRSLRQGLGGDQARLERSGREQLVVPASGPYSAGVDDWDAGVVAGRRPARFRGLIEHPVRLLARPLPAAQTLVSPDPKPSCIPWLAMQNS